MYASLSRTHALYIHACSISEMMHLHIYRPFAVLRRPFSVFVAQICRIVTVSRERTLVMNTKKSSISCDIAGRRSSTSNNNNGSTGTTTTAMERKEVERNRRQHMKSLCAKLASLIPKEHCSSRVYIYFQFQASSP